MVAGVRLLTNFSVDLGDLDRQTDLRLRSQMISVSSEQLADAFVAFVLFWGRFRSLHIITVARRVVDVGIGVRTIKIIVSRRDSNTAAALNFVCFSVLFRHAHEHAEGRV